MTAGVPPPRIRSAIRGRTGRSIFLTPGPRALPHIPATRRALPLANRALRSNTLPRRRPSLPLNLTLIVVIAVHHALTIRHGMQHRRSQTRKSYMLLKKCPRIRSCDRLEVGRKRETSHFQQSRRLRKIRISKYPAQSYSQLKHITASDQK